MDNYIRKFIKSECTNYNGRYGACLDVPCKALAGERCGYFEWAVLGPVDYKFRLPDWDYQKLFAQYADLTCGEKKVVKQRRCPCGNPILYRKRFCPVCSRKRRQNSGKRAALNFRRKQRVSA